MRIPILNIREFEKEEPVSDFYSNTLEKHLRANKDLVQKPHSHDFYLCVIFTEGTGQHEIDFNTYSIQRGSVFFLRPGQSHFWQFESEPAGYIFFHTREFYDLHFLDRKLNSFSYYFSLKNPPVLTLPEEMIKSTVSRFREINAEFSQEQPFKKPRLASLLDLVYIDLARNYVPHSTWDSVASPTYLKTLVLLEKYIEESYQKEKSAKFYAERLNITTKHLNRITRTTLSRTTTELITDRVILEAKRLIVHSQNPLSRISDILGFSDYAYFSKVFKLRTGITPRDFKRKYQ